MFHRKTRRFGRRNNGRNNRPRDNSQSRMRTNQFTNGHSRNNFRLSLSAEKSFEKYTSLAKEAMSAGDITLSENYLQHADHFMRIIEDKNKNKSDIKDNIVDKPPVEDKKSISDDKNIYRNEEIKSKD